MLAYLKQSTTTMTHVDLYNHNQVTVSTISVVLVCIDVSDISSINQSLSRFTKAKGPEGRL